MMNMTETVKQLIIINVIFFVGSMLVPAAGDFLALFYFENSSFKVWQPLTHMFMHGGIMHIFFNMFALFSLVRLNREIVVCRDGARLWKPNRCWLWCGVLVCKDRFRTKKDLQANCQEGYSSE